MPTPTRQFRAPDELWFPALEKAEANGHSVPDILREALERYNADISDDQSPDSTAFVVRYRARRSPRSKQDGWNLSTPLPEDEARTMFRQLKRAMDSGMEVQLIRRADYVIEQT